MRQLSFIFVLLALCSSYTYGACPESKELDAQVRETLRKVCPSVLAQGVLDAGDALWDSVNEGAKSDIREWREENPSDLSDPTLWITTLCYVAEKLGGFQIAKPSDLSKHVEHQDYDAVEKYLSAGIAWWTSEGPGSVLLREV